MGLKHFESISQNNRIINIILVRTPFEEWKISGQYSWQNDLSKGQRSVFQNGFPGGTSRVDF